MGRGGNDAMLSPSERLAKRSVPVGECLLWIGFRSRKGTGMFRDNGKRVYVHRAAYEIAYGPLDADMVVRQTCGVMHCIRPEHLYAAPLVSPPEQRFWAKVEKTDGCWLWRGAMTGAGYGAFWDGARRVDAHRFSCELAYGSLSEGVQALHRCDNKLCVRPDHLYPGTQEQNVADMIERGRDAGQRAYHERRKLARLAAQGGM